MTTTSVTFVTASIVSWTPVKGMEISSFASPLIFITCVDAFIRGCGRVSLPHTLFRLEVYHTETNDPRDMFRISVQQPKK